MSETLVFVPTALERDRLDELGGLPGYDIELCGFGPIAAAARTAQLAEQRRPAGLLLLGIAGSYDCERHPVGSVVEPGRVHLDGVGAGTGDRALGPEALGFPQWPGTELGPGDGKTGTGNTAIFDCIELGDDETSLLTVCAASATPEEAQRRRQRFTGVAAEDLEGFGVALAARLAGIPLRIVRGLSNVAGDRDHTHWRIDDALSSARELALAILGRAND